MTEKTTYIAFDGKEFEVKDMKAKDYKKNMVKIY